MVKSLRRPTGRLVAATASSVIVIHNMEPPKTAVILPIFIHTSVVPRLLIAACYNGRRTTSRPLAANPFSSLIRRTFMAVAINTLSEVKLYLQVALKLNRLSRYIKIRPNMEQKTSHKPQIFCFARKLLS